MIAANRNKRDRFFGGYEKLRPDFEAYDSHSLQANLGRGMAKAPAGDVIGCRRVVSRHLPIR
jgi:hypothetical protein